MTRGRPPKGLAHVDALTGDAEAKGRMKAILATMAGDLSVAQACERLGISESRFHELRHLALEGMLTGLEPRAPGRPPKEPEESASVSRLKEQLSWMEEELEIARVRTEIAIWKPSLLRDTVSLPPQKKGSSQKHPRSKPRRKPADRSDT